ncbi:hypothetical protein JTB14_034563 [Gonioctena quinquepunctata]|nr:hypothetical protein JTB14_034563 [Gonioctena quinquepunctata]
MLLTTSWILDLFIIFAGLSFFLYKYSIRKFNYWKKCGVYNPKPIPFFGNIAEVGLFKITIGEWLKKIYDSIDEPYFGIFVFDEPYLVMKSPQLIKHITVKDFAYFTDRSTAFPKHDEIHSNMLFFQRNPEWKNSRVKLTPVFTSGKLKTMFSTVNSVGEDLKQYLTKNIGILEAKEVCSKYSTEVIAKTFFGINSHCFDDHNAMFRRIGRSIFDFRWRNAIIQTAYFFRQKWVDLFHLNFVEKWVLDHFSEAVSKTVEAREKSSIRKNDFIDILRDMRKDNELIDDTDLATEKIIGQAMQFFAAGVETTSATISFTLYELCMNPEIQNNLRKEIITNIEKNTGVTYDGLLDMKYLDRCINETLRKYPVLPFLDRRCLEDYELPGTDLIIKKGMNVYIPMYGMQLDEKYFPEPQKYNPDRFLNKNFNTNGLVYMPFGDGPRACIGERFGMLSTKLGLVHVLSKFEVEKCSETPCRVEFEPKSFVLQSKIGLSMRFKDIIPPA